MATKEAVMAEVLVAYEGGVSGPDGRSYAARACGRERDDQSWEGWLEFVPVGGGSAVRTGRETTQPNRGAIEYWAGGLTASYLDGALLRTLSPKPVLADRTTRENPAFDGPNEPGSFAETAPAGAVLDPFEVYAEGDEILRQQLHALDEGHLRNIIRSYGLSAAPADELRQLSHSELIAVITTGVETKLE
jgi:hypothetical protein